MAIEAALLVFIFIIGLFSPRQSHARDSALIPSQNIPGLEDETSLEMLSFEPDVAVLRLDILLPHAYNGFEKRFAEGYRDDRTCWGFGRLVVTNRQAAVSIRRERRGSAWNAERNRVRTT